MSDPQLFGTEEDYAWDAWRRAFDPGTGPAQPDRARFEHWWINLALRSTWGSLHELMRAAWQAGCEDRHDQSQSGFRGWWQEVLEGQPKVLH